MEQRIKDIFNERILSESCLRFAIPPESIRLLDGFESFIYEFTRHSSDYVLRISHSIRRTPSRIRAEVDWINFLYAHGVGVARAIESENGELVESIDDLHGGQFLATAFEKANGKRLKREEWTPAFFHTYGELIGRMHALAKTYEPSRPDQRRGHWNDPDMLFADHFLPPDQTRVRKQYHDLLEHLATLPRDKESYGLIHQDAHLGNFFVDDRGRITLFDFDDCAYSWFANDIAIVLFYVLSVADDKPALTREFLPPFLEGYSRQNILAPAWLATIPSFLKLREIDLYGVIYRSFDVNDLSADPWVSRFMAGRRERIESGFPYVEIDFREFTLPVRL